MNIYAQNTCAIIVTYHPDPTLLQTLTEKLSPQVGKILTIDNTINNVGLGEAYNTGINWAKKNGFEYVLLFDQDSCPADNMVSELLKAHQKISSENKKIAVVGPNHIDARTNAPAYAAQLEGCTIKKCYCSKDEYISATHIISSGSLIAIKNIETIGEFDAGLFIDYVDIEWGLRAHSKGYLSYYICPAVLYHRLGDNLVRIFGRYVPFYNPLRCFYTFRNSVLLCKKSYIPLGWKLYITYQNLQRFLLYIVRSPTKLKHIRMMFLGICHGLLGKVGKKLEH
jgi:rhamnosyltransferase